MSKKNNYGIDRYIPANIKREVRQRCRFGCVICGFPIYEYEHFNPEFKDLREDHKAEGITLLCPNCHTQKTNGTLPVENVIEANKNPFCINTKYLEGKFYLKKEGSPIIKFAGSTYTNLKSVINIGNTSILSISKSDNKYEPFLLSGIFYDTSSKMSLLINQNNWISNTNQWDIEKVGSGITIREAHSKVVLDIKINENKEIVIDRLQMQYKNIFLDGDKESLKIYDNNRMILDISNCNMSNSGIGIQIGDKNEKAINSTINFTIKN
jgi:hypothetical protein